MTEKEKIEHYEHVTGNKYNPNLEYLDARGTAIKEKGVKCKKETLIISSPIGSRWDITEYWVEADEVKCGCWNGNLKDFESRVKSVHKTGKYRKEYLDFIGKCKNK